MSEETLAESKEQAGRYDTINQKLLKDSDSNDPHWQRTINKVVRSVVSIRFSQVEFFDTAKAVDSEATGFIVDSELGIVLTNKHVVGPGPFIGHAIFYNYEQADLKPLFRDPIHDFGFLQFNPKDIKHIELQQLELRPDLAKVGSEIKVIGNDSGEQLSILSGVISRLDRNAPFYGLVEPNDFNSEYIQAATSASGGSSGSPVVDIDGYAIALQTSGKTATNFFCPVSRALRALRCLRNNQPITRGTIQVQWKLESYAFAKALGFTEETEDIMRNRFPSMRRVLICSTCLPDGPANELIKEGDCLISINDQLISTFITVDEILDSNVGKEIRIIVQRSGEDLLIKCVVQDLYSITPSRYLKVCGSVFNDLSYQVALPLAVPVKGVFLSLAEGCFLRLINDCIIDSVDDIPTPNLDSFIEVMRQIANKSHVVVKHRDIRALNKAPLCSTVFINKNWGYDLGLATYNNDTGLMDFINITSEKLCPIEQTPKIAKFVDLPFENNNLKTMARYFVTYTFNRRLPVKISTGYGLIIDSENGFVIIFDSSLQNDMLDVSLYFAESVCLPGSIVFIHPTKDYCIVKYNPLLVLPVFLSPKFSDKHLKRGDKVLCVCCSLGGNITVTENKVIDIDVIDKLIDINFADRSDDTAVEDSCSSGSFLSMPGIIVDSNSSEIEYGLLVDGDNGAFRAFRCGNKKYVEFSDILWELKFLKKEEVSPNVKFIDAEFASCSVWRARMDGIPEEWLTKIENKGAGSVGVWYVSDVSIGLDNRPSCALKKDDIVLAAKSEIISGFRDIESAIKDSGLDQDYIQFEVVRDKKIMKLDVKLANSITGDYITSKFVIWSGATLEIPLRGTRKLLQSLPSFVYCTFCSYGFPNSACPISVGSFITHVNEVPTPTLEDFVEVVKEIQDNSFCKLRLVGENNVPEATTLKVNYHYFPTEVITRNGNGEWKKELI